jgi:hypothetical protein
MKKLKITFFVTLVFTLFFSMFNSVSASQISEGAVANLLLVPLDDRPANTYFPTQVGKAAGINVFTPPEEIIGYFNTPGDTEAVAKWILEHADKADGFAISTSMLAYGGLIASRTGDKPIDEAMATIQVIKKLKEMYPEKKVYIFDTIQRLAVTVTSEESRDYYDLIREWAILYDKVHNLGFEEDRARLEELEESIPEEVLQDYLAARARNHEINKLLIDWVNEGYIDYLVLAQDDASQYGLHRAERDILVGKINGQDLNDKVTVFPGADEVGLVLVSRFVTDVYREHPNVYVEYGGIHGSEWIAPLEDIPFSENVEKHIVASGGKMAINEFEADIHLILNTPSANQNERELDIRRMVERIGGLVSDQEQVVIGDVLLVNKADEAFVKTLSNQVDLTRILSYSGWNTAGNALGITVGHAISRDAFLSQQSGFGVPYYKKTAKAHYEFLLHRFAKDQGYKNVVQPAANQYVAQIGANQWDLGESYDEVNGFVQEHLTRETETWYHNYFAGKKVYVGSRGNKDFYATIGHLVNVHVQLPWPRTFEAELEPELELQ